MAKTVVEQKSLRDFFAEMNIANDSSWSQGHPESEGANASLRPMENSLKSASFADAKSSQAIKGNLQTTQDDSQAEMLYAMRVVKIAERIQTNWAELSGGDYSAKEWLQMVAEDPVAAEDLLSKSLPQKEN